MRAFVLGLLAAICLAAAPARAVEDRDQVLLLYGDSIATESSDYLEQQMSEPGWDMVVRAFPGASLCDWYPR